MILSIDPGLATGVARLEANGTFTSWIQEGGFDGIVFFMLQTWWEGDWGGEGIEAVVIENFIPRGGALSIQLDALHIIGAVKLFCLLHSIPLVIQTPTQAKSFATNDKLKAVGWFNKGTEGHDNDAARHMLVLLSGPNCPAAYRPLRDDLLRKLVAG